MVILHRKREEDLPREKMRQYVSHQIEIKISQMLYQTA